MLLEKPFCETTSSLGGFFLENEKSNYQTFILDYKVEENKTKKDIGMKFFVVVVIFLMISQILILIRPFQNFTACKPSIVMNT